MMKLTEKEIRYGIEPRGPHERAVVEVAEIKGSKELTINCTQLGGSSTSQFASAKEKKRILEEWCSYLRDNPTRFTSLHFGTRMPQELLDAVGCQRKLVRLSIKWGSYQDLSALAALERLRVLVIGSGAQVRSVAPLVRLKNLVALEVENFQKVTDYAPLATLKKLQSLSIDGDGKLESLEFLRRLPQLRSFRLFNARLQDGDYRPVLALRKLERLVLRPCREVNAIYEELCSLPRLKWGLLKESPEYFAPKRAKR